MTRGRVNMYTPEPWNVSKTGLVINNRGTLSLAEQLVLAQLGRS